MPYTMQERVEIMAAALKRWTELTLEDMDKDKERVGSLPLEEQTYLAAYWRQFIDALFAQKKKTTNPDEKWSLIDEEFGEALGLPSHVLKPDITARLDWMKRRIAKDYEREVRRAMDAHDIISPVEQIFLMEWKYSRIEERYQVVLEPQKRLETSRGPALLDFLITSRTDGGRRLEVGIELDGHEFHEKTHTQVERDKRRERSIVASGVTVFRFTGFEIIRNSRACVDEIAQFFEKAACRS